MKILELVASVVQKPSVFVDHLDLLLESAIEIHGEIVHPMNAARRCCPRKADDDSKRHQFHHQSIPSRDAVQAAQFKKQKRDMTMGRENMPAVEDGVAAEAAEYSARVSPELDRCFKDRMIIRPGTDVEKFYILNSAGGLALIRLLDQHGFKIVPKGE